MRVCQNIVRLGAICVLSLAGAGGAAALDYPTKPVRWIVGYPAGGSTDVPVDFEGVNEATPFVISDQIDSLNVSYGLTTFAPDQLLGALDVLTATIPQPGSGSIHVVNSNAAAAIQCRQGLAIAAYNGELGSVPSGSPPRLTPSA